MPIYEYECTKCGHQTEVWQRITDQSVTKCDRCKGKMRKLISQSSFHLKGSGWYVTDYKKSGQTNNSLSHKGGSGETNTGDTASKKESASESKE